MFKRKTNHILNRRMLRYDDSITINYPHEYDRQLNRWQQEINGFDTIDLHKKDSKNGKFCFNAFLSFIASRKRL